MGIGGPIARGPRRARLLVALRDHAERACFLGLAYIGFMF